MIHRYEIPCMDLQQIHQSGQCFRMVPLPEHTYPSGARNGYRLISGLCVLRAWQDGPFVCLDCPHEDLSFWLSYLDMGRGITRLSSPPLTGENTYLKAAAMSGKRLDRLKNKLQPKKLHAKHKNRQRLNRYNNKLLVDTLEMLVADGIVQMDNTLQKLKLLQQVFLGKQSNLNNFTKVVRKSL